MRTSETALNLIRQFEGFRSIPYRCPGNYVTVGYGHVIRPGESLESMSQWDAEQLLLKDVALVNAALHRLIVVPLLQHQYDCLLSFVFNIGTGAFQRSKLRQCVNRGHHVYVPAELLKWVRSNGKISSGLVRRRTIEARLYQGSLSATHD